MLSVYFQPFPATEGHGGPADELPRILEAMYSSTSRFFLVCALLVSPRASVQLVEDHVAIIQ